MTTSHCTPRRRIFQGLALSLTLVLATIAGCGGGVGTGGTGSYAQGSITGFGSVIVNDVRYDDSAAQVFDTDGNARSKNDLRLGMTVQIDGSPVSGDATAGYVASATRIRYASEMLGPVDSVDLVTGRLTLLGQTVQTGATTVFDEALAGGLAAVSAGDTVEVHAGFDAAAGLYRATRIEAHAAVSVLRLRGVVTQLDTGAQRFVIGSGRFDYGSASGVPATLANGDFVRLRLRADGAGRWTVLAFDGGGERPAEGREAKLKGLISAFASAASFSVNGQAVDASGAQFPDGAAGLALGARVEVEGRVQGGVLRADEVKIESAEQERDREFELHGAITAIDRDTLTFVLRGVVVSYAGDSVRFKDGTVGMLDAGVRVEVKGRLGAGGTLLQAEEIQFGD